MSIGSKIKKLRQDKNWSQVQLAQKINVNKRFVSAYETSKSVPSAATLQKLSEVFGVSVDYLLSEGEQTRNLASVPITDKSLLEYFEEVQRMSDTDQQAVKTILEALVIKNKMADLMQKK